MEKVREKRRALSHVGGKVELGGPNEPIRRALAKALDVDSREQATLAHVHGFHSYPARLHPDTAARLITALAPPDGSVLDPFCGSGTVLVEARRLGRRAFGVDINPLAVELAWLKTRGIEPDEAEELVARAQAVVEHAETRRAARAGPTRRYSSADRELFDVHVLLELDGLKSGIDELGSGPRLAVAEARRMLRLVLSAIVTKVSKQPGDTVRYRENRRLRSGHTITLFGKKTEELARRMLDYTRRLPERAPVATARAGDARDLRLRSASIDLVVSSPPYPGVYDYLEHHATRLRWLGLEAKRFARSEIGSRRELGRLAARDAEAIWSRDLSAVLAELDRVLAPGGRIALVMADSVLAGRAAYADELVLALAKEVGLEPEAIASQRRPHFHAPTAKAFRARPRREHVMVFSKRLPAARSPRAARR